MVSQVGTWNINTGNQYLYAYLGDDGKIHSNIPKYDNTGAAYFYFAKERLSSNMGEYGVEYVFSGESHSPFNDSSGSYNGAAVFPNGATVYNALTGYVFYSLNAEWIAAELQGGTGELHYKLQSFDKTKKEWVDVPITEVTDSEGNKLYTGKLDLLNFSAEMMAQAGAFLPVRKYDENGNLNQYRIVQTVAQRTDNGSTASYITPFVTMACNTETGEPLTEIVDGKTRIKLEGEENGRVRIKIGNNQFDVQAFRRDNGVIDYTYRLVGEVEAVLNKDWSNVPINLVENAWKSSINLQVKVFNYKTGNYDNFDEEHGNPGNLLYTDGTKDGSDQLIQYSTGENKSGQFTVTRNTIAEVNGWESAKQRFAVDVLNLPMYDAEGHLNKYSIVETNPPENSSQTYSAELDSTPKIYTALNSYGSGGERIDFHKVWMDDGEEEYKSNVRVDLSARAMPLPYQSSESSITLPDWEDYDSLEELHNAIDVAQGGASGSGSSSSWSVIKPEEWNTLNPNTTDPFMTGVATDRNLGWMYTNTDYTKLTTDGTTVPLKATNYPGIETDRLDSLNSKLLQAYNNKKLVDIGAVMNEENIWTARVPVRLGYSYEGESGYRLTDFQEYLTGGKIEIISQEFHILKDKEGVIQEPKKEPTNAWIAMLPEDYKVSQKIPKDASDKDKTNIVDLTDRAVYAYTKDGKTYDPISFPWFAGYIKATYNKGGGYDRFYAVQEEPKISDGRLTDVTFTNTRIGLVNYHIQFDWKVGSRRPEMQNVSVKILANYQDGNGFQPIQVPSASDPNQLTDEITIELIKGRSMTTTSRTFRNTPPQVRSLSIRSARCVSTVRRSRRENVPLTTMICM